MMRLVLGTHNRHKVQELAELLGPWGFELVSLDEFPKALVVDETGDTFAANAALKACQQARHLGQWVLAEDSGLVVDALGGRPGVYSARYAGENATDEQNNRRLLDELSGVPDARRTAHYVCHAVLADPTGQARAEAVGQCHGVLRHQADGSGGFGYDPLFELVEYRRTFGTLSPAVKAVLSHRARAIRALLPDLLRLAPGGHWAST